MHGDIGRCGCSSGRSSSPTRSWPSHEPDSSIYRTPENYFWYLVCFSLSCFRIRRYPTPPLDLHIFGRLRQAHDLSDLALRSCRPPLRSIEWFWSVCSVTTDYTLSVEKSCHSSSTPSSPLHATQSSVVPVRYFSETKKTRAPLNI